MTILTDYIESAEGVPMVWGESDCSAWVANWVSHATGVSLPLPQWSTRREAQRLIVDAGSLHALWSDALAGTRFYRTWQPVDGDVGIINTGLAGPVGCIFCCGMSIDGYKANAVAVRSENGVNLMGLRPANMIAAWSIGYEDTN